MMDPFRSATTGGLVNLTDLNGSLLLITPTSYEKEISTVYGEKDGVRATLVDLSSNPYEEHFDVLLLGGVLIGMLKRDAEWNQANPEGQPATGRPKMVLGILGKGEAKKGQKAPWTLLPPSESDKETARAYLAALKPKPENPFRI